MVTHIRYAYFNQIICTYFNYSIVENRSMEYCLQEKGKGCERPKLDPFSAEVMALTRDMPKVTCDGFDWIVCKKSECYVTQEILNNVTDISCDYRDIIFSLFTPRWEGVKTGLRPVKTYPNPQNHGNSYNVMILAFDSSSHNGFMRKMPKSYKYLSKNAIIMNGFNIVGDGTPAALFPIFTGKPEEEHPDARKKITKNVYVDHRSFIFYKLKSFGYQTAYWEDSPHIGTFQYRFNGFQHQPADHYFRPFFLEHSSLPFNTPQYCTGSTPTYELMMNISDELFQLDGKKFCFTIIGDICHNDFNQMSTADDLLLSFMESWSSRKILEDTLLVVMGDHGSRSKCENRQMTFVKSVMRQKVDDQVLKYVNYKEEDAFFETLKCLLQKHPANTIRLR
ncbi:hypothetical protein HF086_011235 [Spodoptera exigua]|uniref:Uncharacterized protein n=1 Tax=Spodoptera exigua TaxID=7107 RepID=A0A922SGS7_SPOEX|nr:hypothetical protein HF086_011235 [Spodoptera exigua]